MEVRGEMAMMGEDLDPRLLGMFKENGLEGFCESDQFEGASSDDQDGRSGKRNKKKKYHRHTPEQIKVLEAYFKNCNRPNENQRFELGKKLSLDSKQVKFWFQNRRTQLKTQRERCENSILKQQKNQLIIENVRMKEAMRSPICNNCGGSAILSDVYIEENHFRVENARLKDELTRVSALANKFLGRPISSIAASIPSPMSNSSLEIAVGHGFDGLSLVDTTFSMGLDSKDGFLNALPIASMPPTTSTIGMGGPDIHLEKPVFLELGLRALDELVKLAQIDNPLWLKSLDGGMEVLNHEAYMRSCPPCTRMKPCDLVTEATRATGSVAINSLAIVETLMDVNQWTEMFPCMVGRASADVIFSGTVGSKNCALQLMHAEFQALSPLVPVRHIKFLRFCKQLMEGVWAIVDVSIEGILEFSDAHPFVNCRRLPSGCIVQDLPNGSSKYKKNPEQAVIEESKTQVTWVEHSEFDESMIHHLYLPFISSGMGFGAHRWLSTLQRQSQCLAVLLSPSISTEDHTGITQVGRSSMVKLAQRMTRNFCAGVCATMHTWQLVEVGNVGEHTRLMIRNSMGNPGEPSGIILSATSSVSMPISAQRLFDFLRNEQLRSEWDELSLGGPMQEIVHIPKGQDRANCVSLLHPTAANMNQNTTLILQEMQTDASGSLIVYTVVDIPAMQAVMSGGDSATVAFLPSGFAIVPDFAGSNNCNGTLVQETSSSGGSLLTLGFQILVDNSTSAKLTMESVDTINNLIVRTIQRIKAAFNCAA
ncbi:hypothetical protein Vadar_011223 [Vaccinium darrowii]|uniref:Uncharacterized protein n=1 Tax=Vaccinium darrowii TaxID=229202 RepID=A0ACB7XGR8_9ERIC|nr:hypothetical protein Vadar_011223 [Vaccinium darrowii]